MMKRTYTLLSLALLAFLTACGSNQPHPLYYQGIKVGKPYEVAGQVYVPKYTPTYDEIGVASWYGPGFHGGLTASGERYNQNDLTAAHKTLPLPSIVRVTNLDNGRSTIIRINDRGPFKHDRIIDLSYAAASKLGIIRTGTAKVRVQYLDQETRDYVSSLPNGKASLMALDKAASQNNYIVADANDLNATTAPTTINSVSETNSPPAIEPVVSSQPEAALPAPVNQAAVGDLAAEPVSPAPAAATVQQDIFAKADSQPVNIQPAPVNTPAHEIRAGGYFIQAGTFGVKDNAYRLMQSLEETVSAKIVENTVRAKKMYRVLAGPFNSHTEAQDMMSRLGLSGAVIVRD